MTGHSLAALCAALEVTRAGYLWQICTGDPNLPANWQPLGQGSKSSYTAKKLVSGTKPWFRVAAFGTGDDNQSPWSDPAQGLVA